MKIIILDFDGVLNANTYLENRIRLWQKNPVQYYYKDKFGVVFDPKAVRNLERLVKNTGAKIVVSSTWRKQGLKTMKDLFRHRKIDAEIIDVTPVLEPTSLLLYGNDIRGIEIENWLSGHPQVENYVIIDDDSDMLPEQMSHFVQTDSGIGLAEEKAYEKALQILNNQ